MLQSFYIWVTRKNSGVTELGKGSWEELILGSQGKMRLFKKEILNLG